MPVSHIEHYLVQTDDIEKTRDWYVDVLGLTEGPHPEFNFPVAWVYSGDEPLIHITLGGDQVSENRKEYLGQQSTETYGSGAIDHIAFRATDLDEMIAHLNTNNVEFTERQAGNGELYQLFLFDPNGVKIELNYDASEAKNRVADVMASNLSPNS